MLDRRCVSMPQAAVERRRPAFLPKRFYRGERNVLAMVLSNVWECYKTHITRHPLPYRASHSMELAMVFRMGYQTSLPCHANLFFATCVGPPNGVSSKCLFIIPLLIVSSVGRVPPLFSHTCISMV